MCCGLFTALWSAAHLIRAVPARHLGRFVVGAGIGLLALLTCLPMGLLAILGGLFYCLALLGRSLLCYHTYLSFVSGIFAVLFGLVWLVIGIVRLLVFLTLGLVVHLPTMVVAFVMALVGIFTICIPPISMPILKTANKIKFKPFTEICTGGSDSNPYRKHPVEKVWKGVGKLMDRIGDTVEGCVDFSVKHYKKIINSLDTEFPVEDMDTEQKLCGAVFFPLVFVGKNSLKASQKFCNFLKDMFTWFQGTFLPGLDTMVDNAQEDTYARLEEKGYPEMVFHGMGGITVRDSPVASYRMKHRITARLLGYFTAVLCALMLDFRHAKAAAVAAGSAKFLSRILTSISNMLLLPVSILLIIPAGLAAGLLEIFRLLGLLLLLVCMPLKLVGWIFLGVIVIFIFIPLICLLGFFCMVFAFFAPVVFATVGFLVGTPVIGTFMKIFCCGCCFNNNVSEFGFGPISDYSSKGWKSGVELFKSIKDIFKCTKWCTKLVLEIPGHMSDDLDGMPGLMRKAWSLTRVETAWKVPGRLWEFAKGCARRVCHPTLPAAEGGILAVVLTNTDFTTVLSPDRAEIVRMSPGGPLVPGIVVLQGPDGAVNLGKAIAPTAATPLRDNGLPADAPFSDLPPLCDSPAPALDPTRPEEPITETTGAVSDSYDAMCVGIGEAPGGAPAVYGTPPTPSSPDAGSSELGPIGGIVEGDDAIERITSV